MKSSSQFEVETEIRRAFDRLYRQERLVLLQAPDIIIDKAAAMVAESRRMLGEETWADVLLRYPTFSEFIKYKEKKEDDWDKKCEGCKHWRGIDYGMEADLEVLEMSDADPPWCGKYTYLTISRPVPCPDFDSDHD